MNWTGEYYVRYLWDTFELILNNILLSSKLYELCKLTVSSVSRRLLLFLFWVNLIHIIYNFLNCFFNFIVIIFIYHKPYSKSSNISNDENYLTLHNTPPTHLIPQSPFIHQSARIKTISSSKKKKVWTRLSRNFVITKN